jgi:hypothetical protein
MQPTDAREGRDLGGGGRPRTHGSRCGRVLAERQVRAVVVVIGKELSQQPPKVLLVQHNHVIEQFPPAGTDPALGDTVQPRLLYAVRTRLLYAVRTGRTSMPLRARQTSAEKIESRSSRMSRGLVANGNVPRSCWITRTAVGCAVTLR